MKVHEAFVPRGFGCSLSQDWTLIHSDSLKLFYEVFIPIKDVSTMGRLLLFNIFCYVKLSMSKVFINLCPCSQESVKLWFRLHLGEREIVPLCPPHTWVPSLILLQQASGYFLKQPRKGGGGGLID